MALFGKRKAPAASPEERGDIFQHFDVQRQGDRNDNKSLSDRFDLLERAMMERDAELRQKDRDIEALLANRLSAVAPKDPEEKKLAEFSLDGLPDPVTDPDKYAQQLSKRFSDTVAAREKALEERIIQRFSNASKQEAEAEARASDLWQTWDDAYGDEFKTVSRDLIEFAASKVVAAAQAAGKDPALLVTAQKDRFLDDVAKFLKTNGLGGEKVEGEAPREGAREAPADGDDPFANGRTAGIFGGQASGSSPAPQSKTGQTDMLQDLSNIQRNTGFY